MNSLVYTSGSSNIKGHKLIAEIGYARVEAKDVKKIAPQSFWESMWSGLSGEFYDPVPRFKSFPEALIHLKEKARDMGGNGIININWQSTQIDGIVVLVKE